MENLLCIVFSTHGKQVVLLLIILELAWVAMVALNSLHYLSSYFSIAD